MGKAQVAKVIVPRVSDVIPTCGSTIRARTIREVLVRRLIILVLCLFARNSFAAQGPATAPSDVASLIKSLADPDPSVRQQATQKLEHMGSDARPQLLKASRSTTPEIASNASEILMKLPWWKITDPPTARKSLIAYGNLSSEQRMELIDQFLITPEPGVSAVLLRLAQEDPSDAVSWHAEFYLHMLGDDQVNVQLRKLDLADARAPIIALAARAFLSVDPARANALLHRLVEMGDADPTFDPAELIVAYHLLCADAISAGDLHAAATLLRQHIRQSTDQSQVDAATFELFAFQADLGPTDDFDHDLDEFSASLGRPEIMYAISRIAEHGPDGSPLLADAMAQAAFAASLSSSIGHYSVGALMLERGWNGPAARELYATITTNEETDPNVTGRIEFRVQQQLAQLNENTENHLLVSEHAIRASEAAAKLTDIGDVDPNIMLPEAYWHRLHVARESHDDKTEKEYLDKLIALPPDDSDASIEVYKTLVSIGKTDQANDYFDRAYAAGQTKLAQSPSNSEQLNDIAWLCARCGKRVPEGLKLANQAVAREPDMFAYIDTAAAANAAAGNFTEAARLEKRALVLRPADDFMRKLVKQYEQAAAHQK